MRRPPRSTLSSSSAASDVYKRQMKHHSSITTGTRAGGASAVLGARQECTVLVTGGDSGGVFSQRRAGLISKLTTLAVKYYPGLIGSVLVVDANWIARQGIKATAAVKGASDRMSASNRHLSEEPNNNSRTMLRQPSPGRGGGGDDMGSQSVKDLSLIHISEPTRLLSISYAVFCLKKKN
eukprot:TRINITY_DN32070_c0_g1_i1.p1 TRINITY_DN32070_c0_g1~~TRINITY_DN32070_c0_g1_i1.p1  ORF type:complete len:180 (-),score=35.97 TRINITY_DN32070_c0_g1_i1:130-669(-)